MATLNPAELSPDKTLLDLLVKYTIKYPSAISHQIPNVRTAIILKMGMFLFILVHIPIYGQYPIHIPMAYIILWVHLQ